MKPRREVLHRRKMCRARPAEVPPLLSRPKAFAGPKRSVWAQHKALLSRRATLIGAHRRLNVWRLLRGRNGSYTKRLYSPRRGRCGDRTRAELCVAVISEGPILQGGYSKPPL